MIRFKYGWHCPQCGCITEHTIKNRDPGNLGQKRCLICSVCGLTTPLAPRTPLSQHLNARLGSKMRNKEWWRIHRAPWRPQP